MDTSRNNGINIFRLFGFQVRVDFSWIILAVLIAWSLSTGFFPFQFEDLSAGTYWVMGIIGALGLFASIVIHELSHSLVARRYGLQMRGITLFMFGGVSEMAQEPPGPKAEFMMSVAGPVSSGMLACIFYGLSAGAAMAGISRPLNGLIRYLAFINVILAVFNLVPAYPLDGGRILRSALWGARGDLRWATRVSSRLGSAFGLFLIVSGFYNAFFAGNFMAGLWWALIGIFLYGSAKMSYRQLLTSRALEGLSVRRFVSGDPVTVAPDITVEQLVNDYVYPSNSRLYPVVSGSDSIEGCVTASQIRETPRGEWGRKRVRDIEAPCSEGNTIAPDEKAINALSQMNRSGVSQLMVVDNGRLAGIVSLRDIMNFLTLRMELDGA